MSEGNLPVFERLVTALTNAGVSFTHLNHDPVYTSPDAARVRGTPLHSGAKALILSGGGAFRLAVMPADLGLDNNAVRKVLDLRRLRFATKEEVLGLTGLTPGSIPPFGSLFGFQTICDERLSDNERIVFNAGSHTDSIQMRYEDYVTYEKPQIARIAK